MDLLNFHHLRYFRTVARKGGVRKAAEETRISQPSISAQLMLLEDALGEKLFRRGGRNLVLTETGQLVLSYADEIFSAGRELVNAVKQAPGSRALKLNVGMTDVISKLLAFKIPMACLCWSIAPGWVVLRRWRRRSSSGARRSRRARPCAIGLGTTRSLGRNSRAAISPRSRSSAAPSMNRTSRRKKQQ